MSSAKRKVSAAERNFVPTSAVLSRVGIFAKRILPWAHQSC